MNSYILIFSCLAAVALAGPTSDIIVEFMANGRARCRAATCSRQNGVVGAACPPSNCPPPNRDGTCGAPNCNIAVNRPWLHPHVDPNRYWQCQQYNHEGTVWRAVEMWCACGTFFQSSRNRCEHTATWVRDCPTTQPQFPVARPCEEDCGPVCRPPGEPEPEVPVPPTPPGEPEPEVPVPPTPPGENPVIPPTPPGENCPCICMPCIWMPCLPCATTGCPCTNNNRQPPQQLPQPPQWNQPQHPPQQWPQPPQQLPQRPEPPQWNNPWGQPQQPNPWDRPIAPIPPQNNPWQRPFEADTEVEADAAQAF